MANEFVSYEQAVALQDLGAGFPYMAWYLPNNPILILHPAAMSTVDVPAPLKSQVFRWFREKYNVDYYISKQLPNIGNKFSDGSFAYSVVIDDMYHPFLTRHTYEQAEDACIDKLIELAKQQSIIDDTLTKQQGNDRII